MKKKEKEKKRKQKEASRWKKSTYVYYLSSQTTKVIDIIGHYYQKSVVSWVFI